MSKKQKRLSKEDEALWEQVKKSTRPIKTTATFLTENIETEQPALQKSPAKKALPSPRFRVGQQAQSAGLKDNLSESISSSLGKEPLKMDARKFGKMQRGKLEPEAKIDLHGMTLSEAHPELIRFVLGAWARNLRLILVVTGKGKKRDQEGPIPVRTGVLKHQVPQWLRMPPVQPAILQVTQAHIKHGGEGAYYVYLRRRR